MSEAEENKGGTIAGAGVAPEKPTKKKADESELLEILKGVASSLGDLEKRMKKIETGGAEDFKDAAKKEDIAAATKTRVGIDPRLSKIVDEILGEDFSIDIEHFEDKPGVLFTLIVPQRLSDAAMDKRPKKDPKVEGAYMRNDMGEIIYEDYYPQDRRSVSVGTAQNFDVIRKHCERVRSYIVSYFQKVAKPLPEFRVK